MEGEYAVRVFGVIFKEIRPKYFLFEGTLKMGKSVVMSLIPAQKKAPAMFYWM